MDTENKVKYPAITYATWESLKMDLDEYEDNQLFYLEDNNTWLSRDEAKKYEEYVLVVNKKKTEMLRGWLREDSRGKVHER